MRRSLPVLSACLLGLLLATLLISGALWPVPATEVAHRRGSGEAATATTDRVRIDHVGPTYLPPRLGDEGAGRIRPLVDLVLLTLPTAAGVSLVAERLTYAPGATLFGRPHLQVRTVSLEAGTLDVQLDGVAFLDRRWPAESLLAKEAHRVEGAVHLNPGDLLAVPAEAAFTTRNLGETPAVSLEVSVQLPQPLTPLIDRIGVASDSSGVRAERLAAAIALPPGISAVVSVGRVSLPPGGSVGAGRTAGPALVIVEHGLLGAIGDSRAVAHAAGDTELVRQGERVTIRSTGEEPLAAWLLAITPLHPHASPRDQVSRS